MDSRKLVGVLVLGFALASPLSADASPILIDGFETPVVVSATGYEYRATGNAGWGWTSSITGVVQFNGAYQVGNVQTIGAGAQSVQLEVTGDFIQRSISTVAGQAYSLSFLLAAFSPPGTSSLGVGINGGVLTPFTGTTAWGTRSLIFVATSASTVIRFENTDLLPNPPYSYPHLDNVAIEAVPEPATLGLLALGLAGLVTRKLRSRK